MNTVINSIIKTMIEVMNENQACKLNRYLLKFTPFHSRIVLDKNNKKKYPMRRFKTEAIDWTVCPRQME